MSAPPITLTPAELEQLTGGATLPHVQVRRLRAAGYVRARLVNGCAIVERAHAEAVAAGRYGQQAESQPAPTLDMAAFRAARQQHGQHERKADEFGRHGFADSGASLHADECGCRAAV